MQASASLCGAEMVEYFELQARTQDKPHTILKNCKLCPEALRSSDVLPRKSRGNLGPSASASSTTVAAIPADIQATTLGSPGSHPPPSYRRPWDVRCGTCRLKNRIPFLSKSFAVGWWRACIAGESRSSSDGRLTASLGSVSAIYKKCEQAAAGCRHDTDGP